MALSWAMRYFFLTTIALLAFGFAGCATTNSATIESPEPLSQLPPQNLASGECGLFIWTIGEPKRFIGFETHNQAKLLLNGRVKEVIRQEGEGLNALSRVFKTPQGESIDLVLEPSDPIDKGQRFLGRLTTQTEDGWDKIIPVMAISSCIP